MDDLVRWLLSTQALVAAFTGLLGAVLALLQAIRPFVTKPAADDSAGSDVHALRPEAATSSNRLRRWAISLGIALSILSGGILAARYAAARSLPRNVQCTVDGWQAFNRENWEAASRKATECIEEFGPQAAIEQERLERDGAALPRTGAVSDEERTTILNRGPLNDVATSLFIKGRAAEKLGRVEDARRAYESAAKLTYGRCWDPAGWFWSPAEASSARLQHLK